MIEAWIPVMLATVIVVGVVGGSLAMMVLKELLPLLRRIAEQRGAGPAAEGKQVNAELRTVERRLAAVEDAQRQLAEETEFVRNLLSTRRTETPRE